MQPKRPESRLYGDALREAVAADFKDIHALVRRALTEKIYPGNSDDWRVDITMLSSDQVVVQKDGRYWMYRYQLTADNAVMLDERVEVTRQFEPVGSSSAAPAVMAESNTPLSNAADSGIASSPGGSAAGGIFLEAKNDAGTLWEIRVINAGTSLNNINYPAAVLREAVPLFAGARVFAKSDAEHVAGGGKDVNKLIGRITQPTFIEAVGAEPAGINATLELLASAGTIPAKLVEAHERDMNDLFGFSIDARGAVKKKGRLREATRISQVNSVDLIIEPGAGGRVIKLIEAVNNSNPEGDDDMLRDKMIEAVKAANGGRIPTSLDVDNDDKLLEAYQGVQKAEADAKVRLIEARAAAKTKIAASGLPVPAVAKLQADFEAHADFKEADVDAAINDERAYLAQFTESGKPGNTGGADFNDTRVTQDIAEKRADMLDDFFARKKSVHSFKEAYGQLTGDWRVTGRIEDCDATRMRESFAGSAVLRESVDTTAFAVTLGNAMNRRMIAEYNVEDIYSVWRYLTGDPVPLNDFRENTRVRWGGYDGLPIVGEGASYTDLTTPGEESAKYTPQKRGGLEPSVTLEAVRNDDVALIRKIPIKMADSAKRTLAKFVLDFLKDNPAIFDAVNLFDAAHNNLGSDALSAPAYAAGRLAMRNQLEAGSNERLGLMAQNLWVPGDLEETGYDLFRRDTNNDESFIQTLKPRVIPVWYWTDPNDWCLTTDAQLNNTVEIGFLDGNEEPEMFVQDNPTVGSLFSNDIIKYKIRHIYGGTVLDFRTAFKSVVA